MGKILYEKYLWVIMSKDRRLIAKGTPRNRELILVNDIKDKKRILTYNSERTAIAAFTTSGFYGQQQLKGWDYKKKLPEFLEAVPIKMTLKFNQ